MADSTLSYANHMGPESGMPYDGEEVDPGTGGCRLVPC